MWELVRKLFLVGVIAVIAPGSVFQILIGLLVCMTATFISLILRPYKQASVSRPSLASRLRQAAACAEKQWPCGVLGACAQAPHSAPSFAHGPGWKSDVSMFLVSSEAFNIHNRQF